MAGSLQGPACSALPGLSWNHGSGFSAPGRTDVRREWRKTSSALEVCRARIGPYPLAAELTVGGALGILSLRTESGWPMPGPQ
jgi:hypothetical protein